MKNATELSEAERALFSGAPMERQGGYKEVRLSYPHDLQALRIDAECQVDALLCPVCGGNNLHHEGLLQFHRGEIEISFSCEGGCELPTLLVQQYKGTTFVGWK